MPISFDDSVIQAFVNMLAAPLERTVDDSTLSEFRNHALFHLECLIDEYRSGGHTEDEAVALAIADFGPADLAAMAMLDEWCRGRKPSPFSRTSSSAVWWSFAWFGIASGCSLLAIQFAEMCPNPLALQVASTLVCLIPPVIAGIAVGRCVPTGNLRALGIALSPLFAHALLAACLMGPARGGILFLTLFVCVWLPAGAVSVTLTSWLRRNRQVRYQNSMPKEVSL